MIFFIAEYISDYVYVYTIRMTSCDAINIVKRGRIYIYILYTCMYYTTRYSQLIIQIFEFVFKCNSSLGVCADFIDHTKIHKRAAAAAAAALFASLADNKFIL